MIGVPLGLLSGYLGGRLDRVLLFLMDTIYTLPGLLLSVTVAFVVGRGVFNAAIALSVAYVPQYYRVVRNHTVSVKTELFIEAAQATGASSLAGADAIPAAQCDSKCTGPLYAQCGRCHLDLGWAWFFGARTAGRSAGMGSRTPSGAQRTLHRRNLVDGTVSRISHDALGRRSFSLWRRT